MAASFNVSLDRRIFMGGVLGISALAISGCVGVKTFVFSRAIRHLMVKSADNAIETMLAPGGYWDNAVYNSQVGSFLGNYDYLVKDALTSEKSRTALEHGFGEVARAAAKVTAPVLGRFVADVGIKDAIAIAEGGPTAATEYLRENGDGVLAKAMNSEILAAVRASDEPLIQQIRDRVQEVDLSRLAGNVSQRVETIMWNQVAQEEAALRANPENDGLLIELMSKVKNKDG